MYCLMPSKKPSPNLECKVLRMLDPESYQDHTEPVIFDPIYKQEQEQDKE